MKMSPKNLLIIATSIILTACTPVKEEPFDGENNPLATPLEAYETARALGRIEAAAAQFVEGQGNLSDPIVTKMVEALKAANCTVHYSRQAQLPFAEVRLSITGQNCPITAKYDLIYTNPTGPKGEMTLTASFAIHDQSLCMQNDICLLAVAGSGQFERSGSRYQIKLNIRGHAESRSIGDIGFLANHDFDVQVLSSGKLAIFGTQQMKFTLATKHIIMLALVRQDSAGNDNSIYRINGEITDKENYLNTLRSLGALLGF